VNAPSLLVARREVVQRIRRPSFLVFTALLIVFVLAGGVIAALVDTDSAAQYDVGIVTTADAADGFVAVLADVAAADGAQIDTTEFATGDDAEQALLSGDIDVIIDTGAGSETWDGSVDDSLATLVDIAWQATAAADAARAAGLDDAQVRDILSPEPLSTTVLDADDDDLVGTLVGFASAVLLFISITTFGSYVLTGVVEEKTTGVIEVLLSHVQAHQLMAGKVLGIGAVALAQFAATVAAALVSLRISGIDVPTEIWVGLPATIGWFVGGFLLYSTLFALAGSFVSRMEDAQGAAAPITTAFMIGYILVFAFGSDPSGTVARVMSILPPFSPLLMPLRMVTGAASVVEVVVAAVLLGAAVVAMIRLAGSIYARTLLHRGSRLRWRDVLRRTDTLTG
jgi:ABC-2 type transport system permease protein